MTKKFKPTEKNAKRINAPMTNRYRGYSGAFKLQDHYDKTGQDPGAGDPNAAAAKPENNTQPQTIISLGYSHTSKEKAYAE